MSVKSRKRCTAPLALWVLVAISASFTYAASLPLPSPEATSSITARELKRHLTFLASDELGGRYTLSQGNRIAARYLAAQLESYGFRGAARDGSFFQRVPLSYQQVDLAASGVTLKSNRGRQEFKYGDDFVSQAPGDTSMAGEMIFVGYGISSPGNNYDDYAGLSVKGKIVVAVTGKPDLLKGIAVPGDEQSILRTALQLGAIGAIVVAPQPYLLTWDQVKNNALSQSITLSPRGGLPVAAQPLILAGPALIKAIAAAMGKEPDYLTSPAGKPRPPSQISAEAEVKTRVGVRETSPARNVVGTLDGADPKLRNEYVVFSAHYDHLKTKDDGEVYKGADDDGSGTASVLGIAQAFSMGSRPKRSILVIFHTGEELGLLGSEFNADYEPVVPLQKMVADFNIDMIGRSRPESDTDPSDSALTDKNSIYVIGADKLSSELNRISEQTNAETAHMRFDYTYNSESHPERLYYRSDHYNYAKHDIPIIFYFTGLHRDYHRTTDDVAKIDFEKMERIVRMIFATGWRVANLDHRVVVDKQATAGRGQ